MRRDWKMVCRMRGITDANRRLECKTAVATLQRAPFASRRALQRLDLTKLPFHPIWRANVSAIAGHTHKVGDEELGGQAEARAHGLPGLFLLPSTRMGTHEPRHPSCYSPQLCLVYVWRWSGRTNSRPPPSQRLRSPLSEIGELEAFREEVRHRGTHHMCPSEV